MDSFAPLLINYSIKFGLILLLFLLSVYWYISYVYSYWTRKGVPGPPAVPFLGNFYVISKPIPLALIDYREKYGKFFGIYEGQKPVLCVSEPKIIKRILMKDFHTFRSTADYNRKDLLSKSLLAQQDEKWKRARSLVSQTFTASKLKKMQHLIQKCSDSMLEHLEQLADSGESFLASDVIGKYTMDVIAKCAFATDLKTYGKGENPFITEAKTFFVDDKLNFILVQAVPPIIQRYFGSWLFTTEKTDRLEKLGFHLVKQRKTIGNEFKHSDLLQLLIDAEHRFQDDDDDDHWREDVEDLPENVNTTREEFEQQRKYFSNFVGPKFLDEEEVVANIVLFLLAGYGTTSALLKFLFYELAMNPDVQQKLYEEIKTLVVDQGRPLDYDTLSKLPYLDAVVLESLRAHPSSVILVRKASEEYYIPEYNHTMEKGEAVMIPVYSIHHDPDFYDNPEQYNPERFMPENRGSIVPGSFLPFGAGPRNCVGMRFALLEAKIALANIVQKFVLVRTEQTTETLQIGFGLFLLVTNPIYVGVKRR